MQIIYKLYLGSTGYATSAQDYIKALLFVQPDLDIKTQFYNLATSTGVSKERHDFFHTLSKKQDTHPQIDIFHCIPPRFRRNPSSAKNIGIAIFETINPPKNWIDQMNTMDTIITASQFNKSVFESNGVKVPIFVVPHCFDPQMFNKDVKPNGRYAKFTFFALGTWKQRKNWDSLIKAFYDGFENKNNVCLIIKTDKPDELKRTVLRIKQTSEWRSKDTAPIYAEKGVCTFEEIPAVMRKGDVYISCSLGEGFSVPTLHALALGMPIIVPKYGGFLEHARPEFTTYINPAEYKTYPNMDGIPQFKNCIWPVFRISEIRDKMLQVYNNWPSEQIAAGYQYAHNNFTYEVVGKKMLEAILS